MAEYIERERAKRFFENIDAGRVGCSTLLTPTEFAEYLDEIEPADVAPVRHGKWIETQVETGDPFGGGNYYTIDVYACSECGEMFDISEARNYCPNCGARMDGDTNE